MPIATSALIGAGLTAATTGASIASSSLNSKASRKAASRLQNQQNEFNAQQAQLNRQYMEDYYNKYDSPSAMLRQYREAGLNPYSYNGSTGSMGASMGNAPMMDNTAQQSAISNSYNSLNEGIISAVNNMFTHASSSIGILDQIESYKQNQLKTEQEDIQTQMLRQQLAAYNTPASDVLPIGLNTTLGDSGLNIGMLAAMSRFARDYGSLIESDSNLGKGFEPFHRLAYLYENQYPNHSLNGYKFAYDTLWRGLSNEYANSDLNLERNKRNNNLEKLGLNPSSNNVVDSLLRFALNGSDNSGVINLQNQISSWINNFANSAADYTGTDLSKLGDKVSKKYKDSKSTISTRLDYLLRQLQSKFISKPRKGTGSW